jgi:AbrB family looped-hinge helix DNA binding protein
MITAKVSSKGQIAVPAEIREKVGLKEGSEVVLEIRGEEIVMRRIRAASWRRLRGMLKNTSALQRLEQEHLEEIDKK